MSVAQGADSYIYYLNVCDQLGIPCGKEHADHEAVCQVDNTDGHASGSGKNLGDANHKTLRYT